VLKCLKEEYGFVAADHRGDGLMQRFLRRYSD